MKSRMEIMKRISVTLIIALMASLCTQQVVRCSVDNREGKAYLLTLNVCAGSHGALPQDTEMACINERAFEYVTHALSSNYLTPVFARFASLLSSERDHPPRFPA